MGRPEISSRDEKRLRLLLVEDEALVSMHMEGLLEAMGHEVLATAANLGQALRAVAERPPDAAVLDVNLNGQRVTPVAEALATGRIPFVLMTGYSDGDLVEPEFRERPLLSKPVQPQRLQEALEKIAAGRRSGDPGAG